MKSEIEIYDEVLAMTGEEILSKKRIKEMLDYGVTSEEARQEVVNASLKKVLHIQREEFEKIIEEEYKKSDDLQSARCVLGDLKRRLNIHFAKVKK